MSVRTSPWPVGVPCWVDLTTPDVGVAKAFYADEEAPLGGMGGMMGAEGQPAHWLVYFGVNDAAAAVAAAEEGGGSVLLPAFETPYGRMAGLADPAGGVSWVIETDGESQPDRSG